MARFAAWLGCACLWGGAATADELKKNNVPQLVVYETADRLFPDMPKVAPVARITEVCGADDSVNPRVAYCTSDNSLYVRAGSALEPREAYEMAHVLGHAVQVRHGVADVALREITQRRDEEDKLRGWVTRQVECIAGFLFHESGLPETDLRALYDEEPMTDGHWGRNPLSIGPKVSIGLEARAEWFLVGQKGDLSACAVGEFGSELLIEALRED
ncbi:putative metalloprotease [Litoreibacter ponti]|uniref:Putative metalloprotease n=2 Tax=Litoreibacter ponti TaxID=1510457 RepID=A0A2T6BIB0_9RHOB|nr:putative metalloprotease [Litoreibacter ponti]